MPGNIAIITTVEDIAEELARRDRFLLNRWRTLSPEQRLAAIDQLQQRAWYITQMSPEGEKRFLERNFKKRADGGDGTRYVS